MNDDDYKYLISKLQDADPPNEFSKGDIKYRSKNGGLVIYHQTQHESCNYWRTVVPDIETVTIQIMNQTHSVPYSGYSGFVRTLEQLRQNFWGKNMTSDVREFVISCPVCQVEKSSHLKEAGRLQPLEIPQRKWDHVAIDFVTGIPEVQGYNAILSIVDKATKCATSYLAKIQ